MKSKQLNLHRAFFNNHIFQLCAKRLNFECKSWLQQLEIRTISWQNLPPHEENHYQSHPNARNDLTTSYSTLTSHMQMSSIAFPTGVNVNSTKWIFIPAFKLPTLPELAPLYGFHCNSAECLVNHSLDLILTLLQTVSRQGSMFIALRYEVLGWLLTMQDSID